ncbi:MAG: TPM domain-containing protein [Chitinophagaceae bacterium]
MTQSKVLAAIICNLMLGISSAFCQNPLVAKTTTGSGNNDLAAYRQNVYDNPPAPDGYVNDYEELFTDVQYAKLDSMIRDFDKQTSIQIALISFDTTMSCADSLEALSLRMANAWGVGQKDKNNGIVIGICSGYGKVKILYGMGLDGVVSDKETNKIINSDFVPYFEKDEYYTGTVKGLTSLMNLLKARNH